MSHRSRPLLASLTLSLAFSAAAQQPAGWREPGATITSLVTAPPQPSASLSPQGGMLVLRTREALPDLGVIARPHLKLAGMRIDGETWGRQLNTRTTSLTNVCSSSSPNAPASGALRWVSISRGDRSRGGGR